MATKQKTTKALAHMRAADVSGRNGSALGTRRQRPAANTGVTVQRIAAPYQRVRTRGFNE